MPPHKVRDELTKRYTYVYEQLTGERFVPRQEADPVQQIEQNLKQALKERRA